ncbi:hypothetical protein N665_0071s0062 [Sinapis alba]|nr:hypothetical protein N665_0071s0062 [Sinapis alba]
MDCNQYSQSSKFVELLSRQTIFGFSQDSVSLSSNLVEETTAERKERRKWSTVHDVVLISSWLNTSKDHIVGNEQKCGTFWKRIAAYFAGSPKVAASEQREWSHCKQRWQKINDLVNKFCGAYEAASREKSSCQNENDVLKLAHEIFYNNQKKKFNLEHAWKELPNDQKMLKGGSVKTCMWSIKKADMAMKERLSKMKLLESLIAKQEPLAEYEEALKKSS